MLRITRFVPLIIWLLILTLLFLLPMLNIYIYSWILLGWGFYVWKLKLQSKASFFLTFISFILAYFMTVFSFDIIAEIIMRVGILFLIIGYAQVLIEYKQVKRNLSS